MGNLQSFFKLLGERDYSKSISLEQLSWEMLLLLCQSSCIHCDKH